MSASEENTCHRCGAEADGEMGGKLWCAGCLHIEGSCGATGDESTEDGADG